MYQVIARKYRPQTFHDVVNQEHVKTTLENAIAQKRIAHGYIFSGQRGTGKTTVARIMARCVNCVQGPTPTPCGVCAPCIEAASGGGLNVIEIDAASNRGINEMRELNQSVRQRPASARFKVFIVDEAHQITPDAFNALLKTIEEPPEWVIFILCTTEAHKIPATIASRCQHFSFRSVDFEDLTARIAWICEQEGIQADAEALAVLAAAGEGSVRDSLSALDQAIACCGSTLNAAEVRALLGAFSLESLETVTQALLDGDSRRMLEVVDGLERSGHNLQHFSRELARYFRNLLVARISGAETRLIAASPAQREEFAAIAARFSEEDLTRYLQLSLDLFRDLQYSLQPRFHLEIGLVRLVQAGRLLPIEQALAQLAGSAPPPSPSGPRPVETAPARTTAPPRSGPSPFELDRAKKAALRPEPQSRADDLAAGSAAQPVAQTALGSAGDPAAGSAAQPIPEAAGDWRRRLHSALMELGMPFTADAVENARISEAAGELQFTVGKADSLALKADDIQKALRHIDARPVRVKVSIGEPGPAGAPVLAAPVSPANPEDEVVSRALANPEVRRFREVFGGEIRKVRNLKE
jgi:DNA polymerase-3 subunit gamma/tau